MVFLWVLIFTSYISSQKESQISEFISEANKITQFNFSPSKTNKQTNRQKNSSEPNQSKQLKARTELLLLLVILSNLQKQNSQYSTYKDVCFLLLNQSFPLTILSKFKVILFKSIVHHNYYYFIQNSV